MLRPSDHLHYLTQFLSHKRWVWVEGRALGVPVWHLAAHDMTRLFPDEWLASVRHAYGRTELSPAGMAASRRALERHQRRNRHHPQAWVRRGEARAMPDRYRREMLADWHAAGHRHEAMSSRAWYLANRHRLPLHPETRAWVEHELGVAEEEGEAAPTA